MEEPIVKEEIREAAQLLRRADPERWATLCRMHLSILLDLKDDNLETLLDTPQHQTRSTKRHLVPSFVRRHRDKGAAEKEPLAAETVGLVHQLVEFLNKDENLACEGLFRKSGKMSRQQKLKTRLNAGEHLNLEEGIYSVHDCASVLKNFLADLSEPLLTEAHYPAHCQIPELCPDHLDGVQRDLAHRRQVQALQLLFHLLPSVNRRLLQDLLMLLHSVCRRQVTNLMDASNLGTMFAPHILCPRKMSAQDIRLASSNMSKAVALMIENAPVLFDVPSSLAQDAATHWLHLKTAAAVGNTREEESGDAVHTHITFCDRRDNLASAADGNSTTAKALAELHAYIQTMPESGLKKKYVKQFNKENGIGQFKTKHRRSKSVGASIKNHFFRSRRKSGTQSEGQQSGSEVSLKTTTTTESMSGATTPVSHCPSGSSPCGSLDSLLPVANWVQALLSPRELTEVSESGQSPSHHLSDSIQSSSSEERQLMPWERNQSRSVPMLEAMQVLALEESPRLSHFRARSLGPALPPNEKPLETVKREPPTKRKLAWQYRLEQSKAWVSICSPWLSPTGRGVRKPDENNTPPAWYIPETTGRTPQLTRYRKFGDTCTHEGNSGGVAKQQRKHAGTLPPRVKVTKQKSTSALSPQAVAARVALAKRCHSFSALSMVCRETCV